MYLTLAWKNITTISVFQDAGWRERIFWFGGFGSVGEVMIDN